MTRLLIIDGHSAIFALDEIRAIHEQSHRSGRAALLQWLMPAADSSDDPIIVVFDGKGVSKTRDETIDGIGVIYSPSHRTADAMIENLVARHATKYDITVASNDRMVLDSISASGAHPCSISILEDKIDHLTAEMRRRMP